MFIFLEKPIVEDNKVALNTDELSSDIQEDEKIEKKPIVEEPCIKKQAYVTTESELQVVAPETPSRRRVARVNYSELATGSPARSKRGRSASRESNGDKEMEPKSVVKRNEKCVKMEPIDEDELSVQIRVTATATENIEKVTIPLNEENLSDLATEMTEKEPKIMPTEEDIKEEISEAIDDEVILPEDKIADGQDNDVTPEITTDNTHEKSDEIENSNKHPENLQLTEVPKPEDLQVMEVTKPKHLQVVEVQKPIQKHPKESNFEEISNNVDTPQKENESLEASDEELIINTENIETELPVEEHIDELPESTSENPEKDTELIEEVIEQIVESTENEDSEPVKKVTDDVIKATKEHDSAENIQEETVQKEELEIVEKVQTVEKELPSESVTQEEEIGK